MRKMAIPQIKENCLDKVGPGRQLAFGTLGPDRLLGGFIMTNDQIWESKSMPATKNIKATQVTEKERDSHPKSLFWGCVKALKFIFKTLFFDDLEGCMRERKKVSTNVQK